MLRGLTIRDMVLIDALELEFGPGLSVLTGETGAGKSILLDCLGFVLGWRGRADLVRPGADSGEVVAVFDLSPEHPAREILAEAGLPTGEELILRRTNAPDGRKAAWVNDRRVSGEVLRALSATLVDLHGQNDDGGLLNSRGHRGLLDAFAGLEDRLAATRAAWRAWRQAEAEAEEARKTLAAARAEEDYLRHAVAELAALAPEPGEEEALDARRRLMQAGARVGDLLARAGAALAGQGAAQGAEGHLADALRWIEDAADALPEEARARLAEPMAALGRALDEAAEAQRAVAGLVSDLEVDPMALDQAEERLFAIRALARKHGVPADNLPELARSLEARLGAIDGGEADARARAAAVAEARATWAATAARLGEERRAAALRLDAAMALELAPLRLEKARFQTVIAEAEPGPDGADAVTFMVSTNPGAPPGALNRIASGGEMSRFLLALKVCLTGAGAGGGTLIFDEIDRGVGGATADAVGRRLSALAQAGQVLVVTHSPQVAAQGRAHLRVEKGQAPDGTTRTRVVPLGGDERLDEVARMLAGETVTEAARAAARALLEGAEA
ncbi:MAG: DNA repair protein RecN [Rhodobacteraceae bacterium]|nr:DNA repair protein RecN [Paracoccaceae bacterium]